MIKIINTKNYIKVSDVQAQINMLKDDNESVLARIKELQAKIAEDELYELDTDMISLRYWLNSYNKGLESIDNLCWTLIV